MPTRENDKVLYQGFCFASLNNNKFKGYFTVLQKLLFKIILSLL